MGGELSQKVKKSKKYVIFADFEKISKEKPKFGNMINGSK